jgi:LuxR family maltose regulon positive regulatory protein
MALALVAPEPARAELVARPRLVARLRDPARPRVVLVAAPAGYGKTTLLSEWELHDPRPFAWLTLEVADNDPARIANRVTQALARVHADSPFVLVIDDAHVAQSAASLEVLRNLVFAIPAGSRLAIASRTRPDLPLGRLRANRSLAELGAADLAMDAADAAALLAAEGLDLPTRAVDALVRRTEGWPAAIYLAALSPGDDSAIAEYVREEVLASLEPSVVDFLMRTCVLDRLTGVVCDALLGRDSSARMLEELARRTLLVVARDPKGETYRCHPLLREILVAELRRREPYAEPALRERAMEWYAAHGDGGRAIDQAIEAGATARAGELLWANLPEYVSKGRNDVVRRWLGGLSGEQVAAHADLALAAAHSHLVMGQLDAVQRWESVATRVLAESVPDDRSAELESGLAVLRAVLAGDGARGMAQESAHGASLQPEDSRWRPICCLLEGVARHLSGDAQAAERLLEDGARRGAAAAPNAQVLCLAQLALMAAERDDWEGAADLCARARAQVAHFDLARYPTTALVFAVSARVRAQLGRVADAGADVREARRLLAGLGDYSPWYEAEARTALARALLRLGDLPAARELIAEARRYARRMADAPALGEWLDDADAHAATVAAIALPGPAPLTTAELRILCFLPTHLSFREIAGRLYVSANTVKTQAHAVYRKLGASSRSQAVAQATQLGLLDL